MPYLAFQRLSRGAMAYLCALLLVLTAASLTSAAKVLGKVLAACCTVAFRSVRTESRAAVRQCARRRTLQGEKCPSGLVYSETILDCYPCDDAQVPSPNGTCLSRFHVLRGGMERLGRKILHVSNRIHETLRPGRPSQLHEMPSEYGALVGSELVHDVQRRIADDERTRFPCA